MNELRELNDEIPIPAQEFRRSLRLSDSLFSKDLAPHYMQLAGKLASSELVPKSFRGKPQDLFICWEMGYQFGMTPSQAMQCIAVINGRACMWGDDMLALCMTHYDFVDIIEEPILKDNAIIGYTCTVKRKGRADKVNIFTLDMAKKAGLLAKGGVWTQYPERMLKLRARGFSLRDAFPDALNGMKPREEVEDYIQAEYKMEENKSMTQAERLKQDYSKKKEANNAPIDGFDTHLEDKENQSEVNQKIESQELVQTPIQEVNYHAEVKRLIEEKSLTDDRLEKALVFYESDTIDKLSPESAQHFIEQLLKL